MRIYIIYTTSPFKAYFNKEMACKEYERLQNLDDYIDYSIMGMPIENSPHNKPLHADQGKPVYCGGCGYKHPIGSKCPGR